MSNIVRLPIIRNDLGNLVATIKQFVYKEAAGLSIVEVIGILEIIKIEVYNDAEDEVWIDNNSLKPLLVMKAYG